MRNTHLLLLAGLFLIIVLGGCSQPETKRASQVLDTNTEKPVTAGLVKGDLAPAFLLAAPDGRQISLESFRQKPVLLYFFTTWCPYCREDLTTLSKVYADYSAEMSIVAVGMDLGESEEKIGNYKEQFPALSGVLFLKGNMDILTSYQIKYTTTKYAVGNDGNILYAGSGALTEQQWRILLDAMTGRAA
ncbi:TPA: TlpA family protein disulfide reductase [Candidatus Woesearchaeota archaeon]|nr:MAG: Thiol-disulfide oxidoreductase [archaeon GW2011_AR11]HIH05322.1 TlpA family protein disulfide reductase [Candidatus Woesearchaeota archaeon]HII64778.1 TlpA family protein disulfide reductase [Candidatus Woesearchaeota archaeon]